MDNFLKNFFTSISKYLLVLAVPFFLSGLAFAQNNGTGTVSAKKSTGSSQLEYPNLASVPARPVTSTPQERAKWRGELQLERLISKASPSLLESPPMLTAQLVPPTSPHYYPTLVPYASQPIALIYFPDGGANLSARDREILQQVADLQANRRGRILVVGHASRDRQIAGSQSNYELSLRRAQSVASGLSAMGVADSAVLLEGRGDLQPRFDESKSTGEAGNRRVEIFFVP